MNGEPGLHNGDMPFSAGECYDKNLQLEFGCCPVATIFDDALEVLVRNKEAVENLSFIDVVLPGLDDSYADALRRFDAGEVNKVIFRPNCT